MASPRTNFDGAVHVAEEGAFALELLRGASWPSFSSIRPAERSASIAICLPGMASRLKRAATSAMRPEPLVMTMKLTITRIAKTTMPMTKLPRMTKLPKASMTWPAASVPVWPSARIRRVVARLSASRSMVGDQQHRREGREFERRLDEQRRHQDQHREDDRDRQQHVEQQRRQRQDQDDDDRHDADAPAPMSPAEAQPAWRRSGRPDPERRGAGTSVMSEASGCR